MGRYLLTDDRVGGLLCGIHRCHYIGLQSLYCKEVGKLLFIALGRGVVFPNRLPTCGMYSSNVINPVILWS